MEANDIFREEGVPLLREYHPYPVCSARAFNLQEEAREMGGRRKDSVLSVIHRDRDCPNWTRWMMGASPKEHRDMQMAELEQEFQRALARAQHDLVERLEAMRASRENRSFVVGVVVLGVLLILATLAAPTLPTVLDRLLNGG